MMGGGNGGMMRGMGPQMRERHMAPIPAEYAGLTSPVAADVDSLDQGKAHFDQFCASCHGIGGLGDGPAAEALDPAPPMLAQTALMTGDDYLFWRISEGGALAPFNSAMPPWKEILDEQARWDTINYARSLGGMHGNENAGAMREEMQATMQAERLASAIYREDVKFSGEHADQILEDFIALGKTSSAPAPVACRCTVIKISSPS